MELVEPRSAFTTESQLMSLTLRTIWISSRMSGRGVLEDANENVWNSEDPMADVRLPRVGLADPINARNTKCHVSVGRF